MEETISLKDLLGTLKKRLVLIIVLATTAVLISGAISYYYLTPTYQAKTQLFVNQEKTGPNYVTGDIQTSLQLIGTYMELIKGSEILETVIEKLDLDMTAAQLSSKITVSNPKGTQLIDIVVQDGSVSRAAQITITLAQVSEKKINKMMDVNNIKVIDKATYSKTPIGPNPPLNMAIALVVGLMAGVGLAFLLEYMDNTVKTEHDIESLGIPVLGVIAQMDSTEVKKPKRNLFANKFKKSGDSVEF